MRSSSPSVNIDIVKPRRPKLGRPPDTSGVTDGGFRADGTFVPLPLHDVTTLTEAFRRAVLRLFVRRELMDVETARA